MRDLKFIFHNPLQLADPPAVADLRKFGEEHLARLTGPNADPALATCVGRTATAHIAYFGAIDNKDVAQAVQESFTAANDAAFEAFKAGVKRKEAAILAVFPKDSATYQEFFPHGMEEYRTATKGNAEMLINRLQTASAKYRSQLEPGLDGFFGRLKEAFLSSRNNQQQKKGVTASLRDGASTLRDAWEKEIYKNIHFIAYTFEGDVEKCLSYFDQSMLRDAPDSPAAPAPLLP